MNLSLGMDTLHRGLRGKPGGSGGGGVDIPIDFDFSDDDDLSVDDGGQKGLRVLVWGFIVAWIFISLLGCVVKVRRTRAKREADEEVFGERVTIAKNTVEAVNADGSNPHRHHQMKPHSGEYRFTYLDECQPLPCFSFSFRKKKKGVLMLDFVDNNRNGYAIQGHGTDPLGNVKVTSGQANYDGGAWWVEERQGMFKMSGINDDRMKVLNMCGINNVQLLTVGRFDIATSSFDGKWLTNELEYGDYMSFRASATPSDQQESATLPSSKSSPPLVARTKVTAPPPPPPPPPQVIPQVEEVVENKNKQAQKGKVESDGGDECDSAAPILRARHVPMTATPPAPNLYAMLKQNQGAAMPRGEYET